MSLENVLAIKRLLRHRASPANILKRLGVTER